MIKADAIYYLTWLKDEAIDDADSHRCEALDMAIEALENERPKGHWIRKTVDRGFNADWVCSECRHRVYSDFVDFNYCPNCGADMRGERSHGDL